MFFILLLKVHIFFYLQRSFNFFYMRNIFMNNGVFFNVNCLILIAFLKRVFYFVNFYFIAIALKNYTLLLHCLNMDNLSMRLWWKLGQFSFLNSKDIFLCLFLDFNDLRLICILNRRYFLFLLNWRLILLFVL